MNEQEYREKVGKVLGIKSGQVEFAIINMHPENHLDQRISLGVRPSKYQAEKLRKLAYEYVNVKPLT